MAQSPFQKIVAHKMGAAAARQAAAASIPGTRTGAAASEYELQRARLGVDLRRLHEIQSVEAKIALKREILPDYRDWVLGVLEADTGAEDDILSQVMVWLVDTGAFDDALHCAAYMLRHRLSLPERFKRTLGTFIVEDIAEAAAKARGQAESFDLALLTRVADLCGDEDMPDEVRAKLAKETGLLLSEQALEIAAGADGPAGARRAGIEAGLAYLRRALELNDACGVKTEIGKLERELKKLAPPEA